MYTLLKILDFKKILILTFLTLFASTFVYGQSATEQYVPHIAYWEIGNGDVITIVLHGGPGAEHSYLRPEWDTLAHKTKVVFYDQRGTGKSDKSEYYTWDQHVLDLKRLKKTVSPNKKVILAGSSWGSELALLYSIYYPDDVLGIVLSGFCDWGGTNKNLIKISNQKKAFKLNRDSLIKSDKYASLKKSKEISFKDFFSNIKSDSIFNVRVKIDNKVNEQTMESRLTAPDLSYLTSIKAPVLTFSGTVKDSYNDFSDILLMFKKDSKNILVKGAGHDPWYSHKNIFFLETINFIDSISGNYIIWRQ